MILTSPHWGAVTWEKWFYLMIPSINESTTSLLTTINGALMVIIQDIEKKNVGAFCCYSLVIWNHTCNIGGGGGEGAER